MSEGTNTPAVSVIVPVHNAADFLAECISSILSQDLYEIEVICVDNQSNDNSVSQLQGFAKADKRVIVIDEKRQGACFARNAGIQIARGDYIAFMDADDRYPSSSVLSELYKAAIEQQALICGGILSRVDDKSGELLQEIAFGELCSGTAGQWIDFRNYQEPFYYHRFIYCREFLLLNDLTMPPYRRFEDPVFLVRCLVLAKAFYALPIPVYYYRVNHHAANWNQEALIDYMQALADLLHLSSTCRLDRLGAFCIKRFENESYNNKPIRDALKSGDVETLKALIRIRDACDLDLLVAAGIHLKPENMLLNITSFLKEAESAFDDLEIRNVIGVKLKTVLKDFSEWATNARDKLC